MTSGATWREGGANNWSAVLNRGSLPDNISQNFPHPVVVKDCDGSIVGRAPKPAGGVPVVYRNPCIRASLAHLDSGYKEVLPEDGRSEEEVVASLLVEAICGEVMGTIDRFLCKLHPFCRLTFCSGGSWGELARLEGVWDDGGLGGGEDQKERTVPPILEIKFPKSWKI